jgi:hypothetical protein
MCARIITLLTHQMVAMCSSRLRISPRRHFLFNEFDHGASNMGYRNDFTALGRL